MVNHGPHQAKRVWPEFHHRVEIGKAGATKLPTQGPRERGLVPGVSQKNQEASPKALASQAEISS